jgi:acetyl-CoA carboxylase carboxyltransferase component
VAAHFEIDDVIDPADTRSRVLHAFRTANVVGRDGNDGGASRGFIDTW